MSRKPTPHNLKVIAGTDRPDRAPPADMPVFPTVFELPAPPQHLNTDGADLWRTVGTELVRARVLQSVDLPAFEQLCVRWQCMRQVAKAGMPSTAADDQALKALFSEFGMTPASRRKVGSGGKEEKAGNKFAARGAANRPQ